MEKDIQNIDTVAHKFGLASTTVSNHRLEIVREKKQKREEMVERRKTKAGAAKRHRDKEKISLSSEEEMNYESDIKDDTNPD